MKHKDYLSLRYDGRAEQEIKTKKEHVYKHYLNEIDDFAKELANQFPDVDDAFFVEVAKRGFEVAYKKSIDSATRDIVINLFDKISDTENFADYMRAIKVGRYLTKKISITYIDPIKKGKNGAADSIYSSKEFEEAPVKTKTFEAGQLLGLIEEALANHLCIDGLEEINKLKPNTPSLFGEDNKVDERFNAQYASAACMEVYKYLQNSKSDLKIKKEICVIVLEHYSLIEKYNDYAKRKEAEKVESKQDVEIVKRGVWVSRIFRLYNKLK